MSTDCDVCEFNKPNYWLKLWEKLKYLNQQAQFFTLWRILFDMLEVILHRHIE